jgi:hypothetical protein
VTIALGIAQVDEAHAETPVTRAASAHFAAGVAYLEGKTPDRYGQAYREFKAAYAASPTWKILGNLGIVAQELERYGEATDAYVRYLEQGEGEIDAREAIQVRRDIERMHLEEATVTLTADSAGFRIVDTRIADDGSQIVNQYGPFEGNCVLLVRAGKHKFQLELDGVTTPAWSVTLGPGDSSRHSFESDPKISPSIDPRHPEGPSAFAEDSSSNSHTLAYLLWGGGAAAAIAGTVFFLEAHHLQQQADADFERNCPNGVEHSNARCVSSTVGDVRAANWRTAALLTGIGGAVTAISGTFVYWLDASAARPSADEADSQDLDVRAWVSPIGIGVNGTF